MKTTLSFILVLLSSFGLLAQNFIPAYQSRVDQILPTNITNNLQEFANLGVKTSGSVANTNTLNWLKAKYTAYGYTANQISEDQFSIGNATSKNLIVTKTGTVYPHIYVIICGHYDTIAGAGVSDNGSGTSILLEAARILKDIPTEYSIKFIHFSGEEQGLVGSSHYVNNIVFQNNTRALNIKVVFNIDQVGGQLGNNNNSIKCERDQGGQSANNTTSQAFAQQLATCTTLYSPLQPVMSNAYASDYMPFESKGDAIIGFYEHIRSHNEHTTNDTFANVDPTYVYNVGKAALGALQHFAIANSTLGTEEIAKNPLEMVKIYPNPAKNNIIVAFPNSIKKFKIQIFDESGKSVLQLEDKAEVITSELPNGVYLCTITTSKGECISRKIIINR